MIYKLCGQALVAHKTSLIIIQNSPDILFVKLKIKNNALLAILLLVTALTSWLAFGQSNNGKKLPFKPKTTNFSPLSLPRDCPHPFKRYIPASQELIDQLEAYAQDDKYSFFSYEDCNENNSYIDKKLEQTANALLPETTKPLSQQPFHDHGLSPVCTFAALSHHGDVSYQNCQSKDSTDKPCLSRQYHKLVHNNIVLASQCFDVNPKALFSLFLTETWLNVNVKSKKGTAQGIGQFLADAIYDLDNPHGNEKISKESSKIHKYLNHFQKKYADRNGTYRDKKSYDCSQLIDRLKNMDYLKGEKNSCNISSQKSCQKCKNTNLEDHVAQDIFYAIALRKKIINHSLNTLKNTNQFFLQDYSPLFRGLDFQSAYNDRFPDCQKNDPKSKLICSTKVATVYYGDFIKQAEPALVDLNNASTLMYENHNRMDRIIATLFPQNTDQDQTIAADTLKKFDTHPPLPTIRNLNENLYMKAHCPEVTNTFPQFSNYSSMSSSERLTQQKQDITNVIKALQTCRNKNELVNLETYNLLSPSQKTILDEVSLYGHNGGPVRVNQYFQNYVSTHNINKITADEFKGTGPNSFRQFMVQRNQEELPNGQKDRDPNDQMSNFVTNDNSELAQQSKTIGRNSSTRLHLRVVKSKIDEIKDGLKNSLQRQPSDQQSNQHLNRIHRGIEMLDQFKTDEDFKEKCSTHLPLN